MHDNKYIHKIPENEMVGKIKYFVGYKGFVEKYIRIGKLVFNEKTVENIEILELLDISGKILLHGNPGTGKTSLAYYISNYFLEKNEIESYKLSIPDLVESNLGMTTKNMHNAIKEINKTNYNGQMVLILDEMDRISVERKNSEEISELKRTLIEFLDFLDGINYKRKILIIGITNSLDLLDSALVRRFDFVDEIIPSENDLFELFQMIVTKMNLNVVFTDDEIFNFIKTHNNGDKIKKYFKKLYIEHEGNRKSIIRILEKMRC